MDSIVLSLNDLKIKSNGTAYYIDNHCDNLDDAYIGLSFKVQNLSGNAHTIQLTLGTNTFVNGEEMYPERKSGTCYLPISFFSS